MPAASPPRSPFGDFNSSPDVIRLTVLMYVKYPLSLRNVEDLLAERGIDVSYETARHWWNRFGPLFAADIRRQHASRMRGFRQWRWHLDEMYEKVNGEMRYLWRAVDPRGRSSRELRHQGAGCGAPLHPQGNEALRPGRRDHHRRSQILQGSPD